MATDKRDSPKQFTFVLIGYLGSGKSSTGNSILGQKRFKAGPGTAGVTNNVEMIGNDNLSINVIDTPGLTPASYFPALQDKIHDQLRKSLALVVVFAIIIKIGRYVEEERQILQDIFRRNRGMLKNAIIIFTSKVELDEDDNFVDNTLDTGVAVVNTDRKLDAWLQKNQSLCKLIKENKLKYLALENKNMSEEKMRVQVRNLLSTVNSMEMPKGICPICSMETSECIRAASDVESFCPASGIKKNTNVIYVDRETLGEEFGKAGLKFYDEEEAKQKNL